MLLGAWCAGGVALGDEPAFSQAERRAILRLSPMPPTPPDPTNRYADDPRAVRLGERLFSDPRLSRNGALSCASCHDPQRAFTDGKPLAEGLETGDRNTPTLLHVAQHRWFFSDGRADSLWAQALQPLESPRELGSSRARLARLIADDDALRAEYAAIFGALPDLSDRRRFPADARPRQDGPDALSRAWGEMRPADQDAVTRVFVNLGKALAAYERTLKGPPTAFDTFVAGVRAGDAAKQAALSSSAQRGLRLFLGKANCALCHSGPQFSDLGFHSTRLPDRGSWRADEPGRIAGVDLVRRDPFNGMGKFSDAPRHAVNDKLRYLGKPPHLAGAFKTPSLRGVARTAPYMRQGQLKTLEDVAHFYNTLEGAAPHGHAGGETTLQPLGLTEEQEADLVAFLRSL